MAFSSQTARTKSESNTEISAWHRLPALQEMPSISTFSFGTSVTPPNIYVSKDGGLPQSWAWKSLLWGYSATEEQWIWLVAAQTYRLSQFSNPDAIVWTQWFEYSVANSLQGVLWRRLRQKSRKLLRSSRTDPWRITPLDSERTIVLIRTLRRANMEEEKGRDKKERGGRRRMRRGTKGRSRGREQRIEGE